MLVDLQDGVIETTIIIAVVKWKRSLFHRKRYVFTVESVDDYWDFEYRTETERDAMYQKLCRVIAVPTLPR